MIQSSRLQQRKLQHGKEMVIAVKKSSKKVIYAANTKLFKVETSLGIHHATASKKNLFLMTGSFALTIVLFLAFSACLDVVHKLLPSVSDFTPDITIASEDESNSIDRSL